MPTSPAAKWPSGLRVPAGLRKLVEQYVFANFLLLVGKGIVQSVGAQVAPREIKTDRVGGCARTGQLVDLGCNFEAVLGNAQLGSCDANRNLTTCFGGQRATVCVQDFCELSVDCVDECFIRPDLGLEVTISGGDVELFGCRLLVVATVRPCAGRGAGVLGSAVESAFSDSGGRSSIDERSWVPPSAGRAKASSSPRGRRIACR